MRNAIIALLGDLRCTAICDVASEFGCAVASVDSFEELEKIYNTSKLVAVFFEPHAFQFSWEVALKSVLDAAPTALPIVCARFSDRIDWPALAEAGAFHTIPFPFDKAEFRQSLGFVWAAQYRASKTVEMSKRSHAARAGDLVA